MYPISYLTIPLLIVLFVDKKIASLFYPFIFLSSIIGIFITLGLLLSKEIRKIFYIYFPYSFSNVNDFIKEFRSIIYFLIIIFKLLVLFIWPVNMSTDAYIYSFGLIVIYFITYIII